MLKPKLPDLFNGSAFRKADGLWRTYQIGPQSKHRVIVLAGTHGNEIAGALALRKMEYELSLYDNLSIHFIVQDHEGYEEEGYGFVGIDGNESMWPPLWSYRMNMERYWAYYDENSTWGNLATLPPRHKRMREIVDNFKPTYVLSLHETIRSETKRDPFWSGAGILLIETFPVDVGEYGGAVDWVGSPSKDVVNWTWKVLFEWLRDMVGIRRWRMTKRALKDNPHYQLTSKIADKYEEMEGELTDTRWIRYMEHLQNITIGKGRILHDPVMMMSEWKTFTDYCTTKFGCPGVTTETFPCGELGLRGIDQRVEQQYKYVKATLEVLNADS